MKLYIITSKTQNYIVGICEELRYLENGYPLMVNENTSFNIVEVNVYEGVEVPEGVSAIKYCYTPTEGFFENPDYTEPSSALEGRIRELEEEIAQLKAGIQSVTGEEGTANE